MAATVICGMPVTLHQNEMNCAQWAGSRVGISSFTASHSTPSAWRPGRHHRCCWPSGLGLHFVGAMTFRPTPSWSRATVTRLVGKRASDYIRTSRGLSFLSAALGRAPAGRRFSCERPIQRSSKWLAIGVLVPNRAHLPSGREAHGQSADRAAHRRGSLLSKALCERRGTRDSVMPLQRHRDEARHQRRGVWYQSSSAPVGRPCAPWNDNDRVCSAYTPSAVIFRLRGYRICRCSQFVAGVRRSADATVAWAGAT